MTEEKMKHCGSGQLRSLSTEGQAGLARSAWDTSLALTHGTRIPLRCERESLSWTWCRWCRVTTFRGAYVTAQPMSPQRGKAATGTRSCARPVLMSTEPAGRAFSFPGLTASFAFPSTMTLYLLLLLLGILDAKWERAR